MRLLITFILFLNVSGSPVFAGQGNSKVEFTFAYDVQEGFPSFMGKGTKIPKENPGTYIDLLRMVEARVPIKLNLVRLPWERCKAYLKLNKVDAINSSFRASRKELGVFPLNMNSEIDISKRITSDTYRLYTKKNKTIYFDPVSKKIKNLDKGVLAPLGYSIVEDLRKNGTPIQENPAGVLGIMKMLSLDRASGIIAHENQANFILNKHAADFAEIVPVEPPITEKPYYILISKAFYTKHPKIAEKIWQTISELRDSHMPILLKKYLTQN